MGGGCYKARDITISKEDVLRSLNDQYLNETIQTDIRNLNSIEKSKKEEQTGKQKTLKNSKVVPLVSNTASTGATTLPGRHTLFTVQDASETNS